jgi:hypothetical protein
LWLCILCHVFALLGLPCLPLLHSYFL